MPVVLGDLMLGFENTDTSKSLVTSMINMQIQSEVTLF